MPIKERIEEINNKLGGALSKGTVKLIAVTKYASDEQILEAYKLGLRDFGENYVLPALEKIQRLEEFFVEEVNWHLLGPLQTNKINKAVGKFKTIQSIHDLEIASLVNRRAESEGLLQEVLIQVNSTGDKKGFLIEDLETNFFTLAQMKNLQIRGLMTMGLHKVSKLTETIYKNLRQCKENLECQNPGIDLELSMGMSNDYEVAVSNGATVIRVGRAIFGSNARAGEN